MQLPEYPFERQQREARHHARLRNNSLRMFAVSAYANAIGFGFGNYFSHETPATLFFTAAFASFPIVLNALLAKNYDEVNRLQGVQYPEQQRLIASLSAFAGASLTALSFVGAAVAANELHLHNHLGSATLALTGAFVGTVGLQIYRHYSNPDRR